MIPALLLLAALVTAQSASAENRTRTVSERTVIFKNPRMPTGTKAASAAVMEASSGRLLWATRPRQRRLIASTTKIMTALVAISRTRPSELLTATAYPAGPAESVLGLRAGEKMSAEDLLNALLLASANDAADTFAARTASSRKAFVEAMNRRARSIGLRDTRFGNAVGLDLPRTYSTASDLAKMTRVALEEPRFARIVRKSRATLRSGDRKREIRNRNPLVDRYSYVDGVKTGRTLAAGYLLVGSASTADAQVISVVTGEPSEKARDRDSLKLLRFGRAFYRPVRPIDRRRAVYDLPVALQDRVAPAFPQRSVRFAVRSGDQVRVTVTAPKELKGPLPAGQSVGTASVLRGDQTVATVGLRLREAIPSPPVLAVIWHRFVRLLPWLMLIAAIVALGVAIYRHRSERPHRPTDMG